MAWRAVTEVYFLEGSSTFIPSTPKNIETFASAVYSSGSDFWGDPDDYIDYHGTSWLRGSSTRGEEYHFSRGYLQDMYPSDYLRIYYDSDSLFNLAWLNYNNAKFYIMLLVNDETEEGLITVFRERQSASYANHASTKGSGTLTNEERHKLYEIITNAETPPVTAPNLFIGDSTGVARQIQNAYIGVNGVAKKVNGIYIGDANGVARKI